MVEDLWPQLMPEEAELKSVDEPHASKRKVPVEAIAIGKRRQKYKQHYQVQMKLKMDRQSMAKLKQTTALTGKALAEQYKARESQW